MKYVLRDLTEIKKKKQNFCYNNITMTPFVQK